MVGVAWMVGVSRELVGMSWIESVMGVALDGKVGGVSPSLCCLILVKAIFLTVSFDMSPLFTIVTSYLVVAMTIRRGGVYFWAVPFDVSPSSTIETLFLVVFITMVLGWVSDS